MINISNFLLISNYSNFKCRKLIFVKKMRNKLTILNNVWVFLSNWKKSNKSLDANNNLRLGIIFRILLIIRNFETYNSASSVSHIRNSKVGTND